MYEDKKSCITINCGCCSNGNSNGNSNSNGNDSTPVGTVISYMGTSAPKHYLICDGTIYNVADYKDFSQFIRDQFGSYNFFGGDGTTTFAVPDLRNEFLRGYHGDKTEKLSGEIGVHQAATNFPYIATRITSSGAGQMWYDRSRLGDNNDVNPSSYDSLYKDTRTPIYEPIFNGTTVNATSGWGQSSAPTSFTSRPINTAVLYCIKYE